MKYNTYLLTVIHLNISALINMTDSINIANATIHFFWNHQIIIPFFLNKRRPILLPIFRTRSTLLEYSAQHKCTLPKKKRGKGKKQRPHNHHTPLKDGRSLHLKMSIIYCKSYFRREPLSYYSRKRERTSLLLRAQYRNIGDKKCANFIINMGIYTQRDHKHCREMVNK